MVGVVNPVVQHPRRRVGHVLGLPCAAAIRTVHEFFHVGLSVAVRVLHEKERRRLGDECAAVDDHEPAREKELVGEDGFFVRFSVAVGVFEDGDHAVWLILAEAVYVVHVAAHFQHVSAALVVETDRHRALDHRLGGKELHFESRRDFEGFERVMKSYGEQIAAVITEPCQGNCAAINPQDGFLELIRAKTEEYGCVFILDEVKTGFRIANGGAQEYYRIKPDLVTYAKALGNGYPAAAFGGKREIMSIIGQGVAQGGTYTNNKPGIAGAYATLSLLKSKPILKSIEKRGQRLMDGLKEIFEENDIPAVFTGYPAMFSFSLNIDSVTCQRDWAKSDHDLYLKITEKAIARGVMPDHDAREPWFLCYEHSDADIDETLNVYAEVVKEVKK